MSHALLTSLKPAALCGARLLLMLGAGATVSCGDLEGFTSKPNEAYCGKIALPLFQDGFIDEESPSILELALTLDADKLATEPGILNSKDPLGICGTPEAPQVLFQNAPLRAIPELQHDVLSALTFGEGHDHDFFAWVDSTCQGTMVAVVSLMKNNYIELRLFKPMRLPRPHATPAEQPGFALFHLNPKPLHVPEKDGGCGFPPPS
ncbi:MAG TPA: hypothetical protein VER12_07940 [Polyangiaceae bacterium]|nr:hypothetical protein [Polyangiaceae bacterium]